MLEPVTINARNLADAQQQWHYQRLNALATALHRDHHPPHLTARQRAPHATPRTNATGSREAQTLTELRAAEETRWWALRRAINAGSVTDIQQASRRVDAIEKDIQTVTGLLADLDTHRGHPCPNPHLYLIRTPETRTLIQGELFEVRAAQEWTLNTHALPQKYREQLENYLLGGRDAAPYRYKACRQKYFVNHNALPEVLSLTAALWGYVEKSR